VRPGPDNDLIDAYVEVIWSDHFVTLSRYCAKNTIEDGIALERFAQALCLCPEGPTVGYITSSPFFISKGNDMNEWKAQGFKDLDRDACQEARNRMM
jgi:hypothetical protein